MRWGIEYPDRDQPLFANVNEASGWCFHSAEPLQSIDLFIDGRRESEAALHYPRADVGNLYADAGDRSLLSGFRCAFDASRLAVGPHAFEFRARTATQSATMTQVAIKQSGAGRLLVTDVFIDIVGHCNLHCAMCPHGDLEGMKFDRTTGVMSPRLFERVLQRLQKSGVLGHHVNLYNWGEPMLHPGLEDILDACRRLGVKAVISSNLSVPEQRLTPPDETAGRSADGEHFRIHAGDLCEESSGRRLGARPQQPTDSIATSRHDLHRARQVLGFKTQRARDRFGQALCTGARF